MEWYQSQVKGDVVSSLNLFLNQNRLSTQVPMHRVLYTNNVEMENINPALKWTTIKFTEEFHCIKTLQDIIKGDYYEE